MSTRRDFSKQILTLAGATTFTSPLFSQNLMKQFSKTNNKNVVTAHTTDIINTLKNGSIRNPKGHKTEIIPQQIIAICVLQLKERKL